MTSEEKTICFKLLDGYAKKHDSFFLAEMFSNATNYMVCFRPTGASRESLNQYECRYLKIATADLSITARNGCLPLSTTQMLDKELCTPPKS